MDSPDGMGFWGRILILFFSQPLLQVQWNLDLRKPYLRKIVATTDWLVHKLFDLIKIFKGLMFDLRKIFFLQKVEKIATFWQF